MFAAPPGRLSRCQLQGLHERTPACALRFLKESMNKFVNVGCSTSWVEVFRLVPGVEAQWAKRLSEGQQQAEWEAAEEAGDDPEAGAAEDSACACRVPWAR